MKPKNITELDWNLLKKKYPNNLEKIMDKLKENYPIQYLIGDVEFYNSIIKVDERVLIPRPETEFLVEKTINRIKKLNIKKPSILELGTGSGCIAIAFKKNLDCEVTGIDISLDALTLAKENALLNQVELEFHQKDMLEESYEHYDILISNPPYVSKEEHVGLETKYEPQNAIFAKNNGLYFYEEIIKKLSITKNSPKLVAFEIGYQQGKHIKEYKDKYLSTYHFELEKDLAGKDRYVFLTKK